MAINLFSYGWINPVLAFVMSTLGILLAILLAIKARSRAGRGRGRLLVYASVALGGVGVFQAHLLGLLGLGVRGSMVRYDPLILLASLGIAIALLGSAVSLVSFGQPGTLRLATASTLVGVGIAGTDLAAVTAMRGADDLFYEPMRLITSVAIGMLAGCATIWFIVAVRGLRSAILAAMISGASICGMHYTAAAALRVEPGLLRAVDGSLPTTGYLPMLLLAPVVLGGAAVTAMLWFFTVGGSTVNDLRAIFSDPENSVEIEPWMIAEVTQRIASGPRRSVAVIASAHHTPLTSELAPSALPGPTAWAGQPSFPDETAFAVETALTSSVSLNRYPPGYHLARPELTVHPQT